MRPPKSRQREAYLPLAKRCLGETRKGSFVDATEWSVMSAVKGQQLAAVGDLELLEELVLGQRGSGRKVGPPVIVGRVRSLTAEDVPALMNPSPLGSKPAGVLHLRHSHHQLARLIAAGKPDQEISLITGYSPAYISSLKGGADFKGLIEYYSAQKEMIFVEVMERMKVLGLNSIDEIQRRFDESPESFTTQQLMDLTELMLIKPSKMPASGQPANGNVTVNVQFVRAPAQPLDKGPGEVIDVMPRVAGVLV